MKLETAHKRKVLYTRLAIATVIISLITLVSIAATNFINSNNPVKDDLNKKNRKNRTKIRTCISNSLRADYRNKIVTELKSPPKTAQEYVYENNFEKCDLIISRNPKKIENSMKLWVKTYVIATKINNPINNINEEKLETVVMNQTLKINGKNRGITWSIPTDEFIKNKFKIGVGYRLETEYDREVARQAKKSSNLFIIPFEYLTPKIKIVTINNNSPLSQNYDSVQYPLQDEYWIKVITPDSISKRQTKSDFIKIMSNALGQENYKPEYMTDILFTGFSSVGAGEQHKVINKHEDPLYPVKPILSTLKTADISHINNTSPLTKNCEIYKSPTNYLCGFPNDIKLITKSEFDVVDGGGFHILQFGRDSLQETLHIYKKNGIKYYGVGENQTKASKPVIIEKNDMSFAFLSYNVNPVYSGYNASNNRAGNAKASSSKLEIQEAKKKTDFVFVDIHIGTKYSNKIESYNRQPMQSFIDAGADQVLGVSSRTVKGVEYYKEGIIFHGLGSFLTDNNNTKNLNEGVILRNIFYKKEMIGYELIPIYISENMQLQLAESKKRNKILNKIYTNSIK